MVEFISSPLKSSQENLTKRKRKIANTSTKRRWENKREKWGIIQKATWYDNNLHSSDDDLAQPTLFKGLLVFSFLFYNEEIKKRIRENFRKGKVHKVLWML